MENKINIAELLKDCPKGMELDCTLYDDVKYEECAGDCIYICLNNGELFALTKYGSCIEFPISKCVIFPKGKTSWEGFVPPCQFKDGDIIADNHKNIAIYKGRMLYNYHFADYYCGYRNSDNRFLDKPSKNGHFGLIEELHLATEEEKQKLFDAIKANGYKWNPETKTLEKLIKPKFKVDDKIKLKGGDEFGIITQVSDCFYTIKCKNNTHCWPIKKQDDWELINELKFKVGDVIANNYRNHLNGDSRSWKIDQITNDKYIFTDGSFIYIQDQNNWVLSTAKFDINTLKPFTKVLVRSINNRKWGIDFFGFYNEGYYYATGGCMYVQCIPYEGNEHLRGTTDDCDVFYKTWE